MKKQAVSVTLERENLLWLKAQAACQGCRSLSQMLDRLILEARRRGAAAPVSVVGTISIDESDPDLSGADTLVRKLFGLADS